MNEFFAGRSQREQQVAVVKERGCNNMKSDKVKAAIADFTRAIRVWYVVLTVVSSTISPVCVVYNVLCVVLTVVSSTISPVSIVYNVLCVVLTVVSSTISPVSIVYNVLCVVLTVVSSISVQYV